MGPPFWVSFKTLETNKMKKLKKILFVILLISLIIVVYDKLLLSDIPPKQDLDDVRIGFINLHEKKIEPDELKRLKKYNCDMWLFLEWNGDNLDNLPEFSADYFNSFQLTDNTTYGLHVLSKDSTVNVEEIGNTKRPYACDYPKHLISNKHYTIYLVHSPPPVPSCDFETDKYISDLILELNQTESKENIIVGDFNTLPLQSGIKKIKQLGYQDSYNSINTMPVGTFGPTTWFPKILKFDYIFHKGNLNPIMVERFALTTSDHTGWVADFRLQKH
jgi:hypothetical protein